MMRPMLNKEELIPELKAFFAAHNGRALPCPNEKWTQLANLYNQIHNTANMPCCGSCLTTIHDWLIKQ